MNKKLFGALALTVALAACTNEDELVFSTENGNDAALANRPVIGNVELSTTPATRAAVVDGTWGALAYVTSDAIGAALVDQPNYSNQKGWVGKSSAIWTYADYATDAKKNMNNTWYLFTQTKVAENGAQSNPSVFYDICGGTYKVGENTPYTVANAIHTNYGYTFNGETWTTEASLVEGHYMFYFPYNANNSARMPINVAIPETQSCTDGNSAIDAFYKGTSPIAVDIKFLQKPAAGEKIKVAATPNHLFAFPQIKIVNNFNGYIYDVKYAGTSVDQTASAVATEKAVAKKTMTIQKVELVYTDNTDMKLWTKATINASALAAAVNRGWERNKFMTPSYTSEVVESLGYPSYNESQKLKPYLTNAVTSAGYATYEQVITCDINKELANGEEYAFNAIMPAEKYAANMLQARVYVKIGDKTYVMLKAVNTVNRDAWNNVINVTTVPSGMYAFAKAVELVRGERYPVIEYNTDTDGNTSVKATAGNILTINLSDLTAFETGNYTPSAATRGFETKEAFVAKMQNATRGTTLTEVTKAGSAALDEHEIAFKNNITLDADLVETIYNNVIYDDANMTAMVLNYTNLAIANDVAVVNAGANKYKLTGNGKSIFVEYAAGVINTNGSALVSGINEVSANVELQKKSGDAGVGIVFLSSNASIKKAADTFRIVVLSGTLTVNDVCGAQINTKNGSAVVVKANLTNAANNFENVTTITNDGLKTIAGNVNNNTITANLAAWPASIPAESKVNNVVINPANPGTAITVDQANFAALTINNTVVTLGTNVAQIRSTSDVDLTSVGKLKQISGSCEWVAATGNIVVKYYNAKNSNPVQINGITAGAGATFNMINR